MNTLKNILSDYRLGLLKTPNIQVVDKKLSDETIEFPGGQMADLTFSWSTFKKSELLNMEFIHVNFESSYWEECLIQNCVFRNVIFQEAEIEKSFFENCDFINCSLVDLDIETTIFNKCRFLRSSLSKSVFNLCDFRSPRFEGFHGGLIGSAVLIDSKFSNYKKSIEFAGEVYFNDIFAQIKELSLE